MTVEMFGDIDDFTIDLSGFSEEELDSDGRVPPGKYHVIFQSSKEDKESKTRCLLLKMLTLAGTNAEGVGLIHTENIWLTEKNAKRLGILITRFGLGQAGTKVRTSWNLLVGRQAVVEIVEEEYEKKDKAGTKILDENGKPVKGKSSKCAFAGIWPADDERVASVPKSKSVPAAASATQQAAANGRQPAMAGAGTGGAAADDLSDM